MATIESKDIVQKMLNCNGVFPGDPQVFAISSYRTTAGKRVFHIALHGEDEIAEARTSPWVNDLTLLWKRGEGIAPAGRAVLAEEPDVRG
jgi:hypothetical protein